MGLAHSPRIVTDGLYFYVDFGNTKSYTNGASTVYDISSKRYSGSIVDSPTFSSDNGGYLHFDGTDDFVDFKSNQGGPDMSLSTITASAWVNFDSASWVMGNGHQFRIRLDATKVGFWIRELESGSTNEVQSSTSTMSTGEWGNIVGTYDGTNQKVYHNGVEVATATPGLGLLDEGQAGLHLARAYNGANLFFDGKLSVASIYNRALTAAEIKQNFNALRGRYGI